jgi:hypothetical protein
MPETISGTKDTSLMAVFTDVTIYQENCFIRPSQEPFYSINFFSISSISIRIFLISANLFFS